MSDIEIAKNSKMKKINEITDRLGIPEEYVENYGKYKAKISIKYLEKISKEESYGGIYEENYERNNEENYEESIEKGKNSKNGKLILVTSINPTPLGEGKTTASIGLCDEMGRASCRERV